MMLFFLDIPSPMTQRNSSSFNYGAATGRLGLLEKLLQSNRKISGTLDPVQATETIIQESCSLLECERATIFTVVIMGALYLKGLVNRPVLPEVTWFPSSRSGCLPRML